MSENDKARETDKIYLRCQKIALEMYEKAREDAVKNGLDIAEIDEKIEKYKQKIVDEELGNPRPIPQKSSAFKNAMIDVCCLIDRWQTPTAYFIINPCDQHNLTDDFGDSFKSAGNEKDPTAPYNSIGEIWNAHVLIASECPPGMIIALMEEKPIRTVSEMIAYADLAKLEGTAGKTGYAYEKAY